MEKVGKKLAVLVGCNYENTHYRLHGCHNDVLAMRDVLVNRFRFDSQHIELLMDKPGSPVMPTGVNIKKALNRMVDQAETGDVLYFHFSGHGTLIGKKKQDEAIIPLDFNYITNVDIRKIVNRIPEGATITILSDSCHSGGLIDKEKEQIGPSHKPKNQAEGKTIQSSQSCKPKFIPQETVLEHLTSLTNIKTSDIGTHMLQLFGNEASLLFRFPQMELDLLKSLKQDEGILLSGCQANEECQDVGGSENENKAYGAFSHAILTVLKKHSGPLSNKELVMMSRDVLKNDEHIETQHPCLYCNDENAEAVFLCQG
ncbi:metacaspase-9-like [Nicotiana tabacum]|uniref:Metacaspase-9-like n=1 Tax=Nicotiana tabacum TaxID=4097 RepID=A0A1S4APQ4_TOBAC|nr:PREDICTED: metacaspase-9-like [Nicotiana tabacum]